MNLHDSMGPGLDGTRDSDSILLPDTLPTAVPDRFSLGRSCVLTEETPYMFLETLEKIQRL